MRKKISVARLEEIYWNNTNKEGARMLGVSEPTFDRYIKKSGIKRKGKKVLLKVRILDK